MRGPRTAMKSGPRLPQVEKALARNEDPTQPKINKVAINLKNKNKKNSEYQVEIRSRKTWPE